MIAIYLSPLYILVNLYLFRWLLRWLGTCHRYLRARWVLVLVAILQAFLASSLLVGFLLPVGRAKRIMRYIGNYWLGAMLYLTLVVAVADALRLLLRMFWAGGESLLHARATFVAAGAACLAVITVLCVGGAIHARSIRTARYEISVDKHCAGRESLRVALVADLHLGYNIGCAHMEQMVEKVNALSPDLVVIAGDIFDNEYEALEDPDRLAAILGGLKSRYGVYACYGNHDIEEPILAGFTFGGSGREKRSDPRMDAFLRRAGIRLLQEEGVLIDGSFYLYGRPDARRPGKGKAERKTPREIMEEMDGTKPVLVLDHQPRELQELADAGVDVDLSGHTHDGQLFPGTLVTALMWENPCGYLRKGRMHSIVTSGVGLFGPNMRVGTDAEVCEVVIHFL